MTEPWQSETPPPEMRIGPTGWARAILRGVPLAVVVFTGLALTLILRLAERPLFGDHRPVTPWITMGVCRTGLAILGIGYRREGAPLDGPGLVVANHVSWLDIFALNAGQRIYFVAKEEVSGWPGIGWLARVTGTIFIRRHRRAAGEQVAQFRKRLIAGHRLLMFPEGTSTDGLRVLPFKPTLFGAVFDPSLPEGLRVQPVTLRYEAASGKDPRQYGWWGGMEFAPHLLGVLAAPRQGRVTVLHHEALSVAAQGDRKTLARACEASVRGSLSAERL